MLLSKENPEGQMIDTIQETEKVTIMAIHILKNFDFIIFSHLREDNLHPNFLVLIPVSHEVNTF